MAKSHITFRQLEVFQEVIREGSVSRAAERLYLTQPTVSIQLRKLSTLLGVELIEYRNNQLQPTDEGLMLFAASADILARLKELENGIDQIQIGSRGRLSLAIVTTANYVVPKLLGMFGRMYPEVELSLFTGNRQEIIQRYMRQADDLYVFSQPPADPDVLTLPFLKNPLVVIAPKNHLVTEKRSQTNFEKLSQERFLLRESGSGTGGSFQNWLSRNDHLLNNTLTVASNEGIFLGVASEMGMAVISEHVIRSRKESVVELEVKGFPIEGQWYLARKRQTRLSPVAKVFVEYLREHLESLEPDYALEIPHKWAPYSLL